MLVEEYGLWIRANDEGSVTATKLSKHSLSVPSSKQLTSSQLRPSAPVTAGHKHDTQRTLPVINSVSSVSSTVSSSAVSSVSSATSPSSPLPDVSVLAPVCFLSFCSASSFSSFGILPLFRSCVYQRHPVPSSILQCWVWYCETVSWYRCWYFYRKSIMILIHFTRIMITDTLLILSMPLK